MKKLTEHQIECKRLTLSYDGKVVLRDLDFTVDKGDYLCIVGENGSGKSTLAKALLSLKKPSSGEIAFGEGKKRKIGYLPQQTNVGKDFPATVREVVLSGCLGSHRFKVFYSASDKEKAKRNMEKMGISHLSKKCFRELSGGQMQRVLLARALTAAEDILLLDEPVNGLDPIVTKEFYKIISELCEKERITVIMISHDFSAAIKYASKILHIGKNEKFFGSTEDYLKSPDFGKLSGGDIR